MRTPDRPIGLGALPGAELIARTAAELERRDPSRKGITWSLSTGNTLPADWLIHSPARPGAPVQSGSELLAAIQQLLQEKVAAKPDEPHFVDIAQLGNRKPDDAFQAELVAILVECARAARQDIVLRYLEGNQVEESVDPETFFFPRNLEGAAEEAGLAPPYRVRFFAANCIVPWFAPSANASSVGLDDHRTTRPATGAESGAALAWLERALAWAIERPDELATRVGELLSEWGPPDATKHVLESLPGILDQTTSCNHAKIVAVDGESVISGGQNLWQVYCGPTAPRDLSMQLCGPAAVDSHRFLNHLWIYVNGPEATKSQAWSFRLGDAARAWGRDPAPMAPAPAESPGRGTVSALAVGNLGLWGTDQSVPFLASFVYAMLFDRVKPSDTYPALEKAPNPAVSFPFTAIASGPVEATQASVFARNFLMANVSEGGHLRISQQMIADTAVTEALGLVLWTGHFLDMLVDATIRQRATADILVSYHPPEGMGQSYADDMGAAALRGVLESRVRAALSDDAAAAAVLERLTVRQTPNVGSGKAMFNHAKVWIVDDRAFYVGSDNIYPAYLQEFGYVVGDEAATQRFIAEYWESNWGRGVLPGGA